MTIQVNISVAAGTTGKQLAILEVRDSGVVKADNGYFLKEGNAVGPLSIYDKQALLLCEGFTDFGDYVPEHQNYSVANPLDDFLRREHPTMTAEAELRLRLSIAEKDRDDLRQRLHATQAQLTKIKSAFSDAR